MVRRLDLTLQMGLDARLLKGGKEPKYINQSILPPEVTTASWMRRIPWM